MARPRSQKTLLILVYVASLLYSFSSSIPLYVNSSFLGSVATTEKVGIIFAVASAISVTLALCLPHILRQFGSYKSTLFMVGMGTILFVGLATLKNTASVIIVFILTQAILNILVINLSTFLETFSDNNKTGSIRGVFLTMGNIAVMIGPFLAGMMFVDDNYGKIYLTAALFMFATYIVMSSSFKGYEDPVYQNISLRATLRAVIKNHDLHSVVCTAFLLSFFYAIMIIYTPIYLNVYMGIPMNKILGIIIPVALAPFVILEIILGKIADKKLGEKEIMVAGFIIMVLFTAVLPFIVTPNIFVWAGMLFMTRVGASAVEVMSETYFYKKIGPREVHLITFLYIVRFSAYILAPLVGVFLLYFLDYRFIFLILGAIMFLGIPSSLHFKDTK